MTTFRDREKSRYQHIKTGLFSPSACQAGSYKGQPHPFCLANEHAAENLYVSYRAEALEYFRQRGIHWHDGVAGDLPSNHLCCSQSACVNTLWPMVRDRQLLTRAFRPFLPELAEALPFGQDDPLPDGASPYLVFEWVGMDNYLGEVGQHRRGMNATSADFAFRFRRYDGRTQMVLGEWKYTESYSALLRPPAELNSTRLKVYRSAFDAWSASEPDLPAYTSFFTEPFYQLMRLTLLALAMEHRGGDGQMQADVVSVVHVAPHANTDFAHSLTSPALSTYGRTVTSAWAAIAPQDRFTPIASESLLTVIDQVTQDNLHGWRDYLLKRYGWWR